MSTRKKLFLYAAMLLTGLASFIFEVFVFQKPDGVLGLIICIVSIFMIFGGIVKLCRLSPRFEDSFLKMLDVFFFLP